MPVATDQSVPTTAGIADAAVSYALAQLRKPYKWGATGPDAYDCSGLVYAAYRHAGYSMQRTTYQQLADLRGTRFTSRSGVLLGTGDLVFPDPGHVGLYIGNGQVVEAPHTGDHVKIIPLWSSWVARRFVEPGSVSHGAGPSGVGTGTGKVTGTSNPITDQVANNTAELRKLLTGLDISNPNPAAHMNFWLRALIFALGALMILEALLRVVKGSGIMKVIA